MTPVLTAGALSTALEDGRDRYNALFAAARTAAPDLDSAVFADVVVTLVAPAVEAADAARAGSGSRVADTLYRVALDLTARRLLGPSAPVDVLAAWRTLLPNMGRWLADDPLATVAAVTNAVVNMGTVHGARPDEWIKSMGAVADVATDFDALLVGGQIAAWKSGMAYYREGALALAPAIDARVVRAALGVRAGDEPAPTLIDRLAADPWASVDEPSDGAPKLVLARRVGAFRGFGGPFLTPPRVVASGLTLHATADGEEWSLMADRYGSVLVRPAARVGTDHGGHGHTNRSQPQADPGSHSVDDDGTVRFGSLHATFPDLAGPTSWAVAGATMAVTTSLSHTIALVAVMTP